MPNVPFSNVIKAIVSITENDVKTVSKFNMCEIVLLKVDKIRENVQDCKYVYVIIIKNLLLAKQLFVKKNDN